MRSRHVVALVIGCLLALPGIGMLVGGAGFAGVYAFGRDDAGYFTTDLQRVQSDTVALTVEDILVDLDPTAQRWTSDWLDINTRMRVTAADPEKAIFVGIAPSNDVDGYLGGVAHDRITHIDRNSVRYERAAGGETVAAPADQTFWVVKDTGTGTRELSWELTGGRWSFVFMNADASPGVAVSAQVAAQADFLLPLALTLAGIGLVLVGIAAALIAYAMSGRRAGPPAPAPAPGVGTDVTGAMTPAGAVPGAAAAPGLLMSPGTPVVMTARVDPALSRAMWLVKWFLAIPHFFVLGFLWAAFCVTTIIAWFAILFTGSYPRAIFDFNVGVLRWTWRVSYYFGPGGMGTDRYPAFSLDQQPEDLATLDVAYPGELSRGLIFVKWFLAIPHLIITSLLVGSGWRWTTEAAERDWDTNWGGTGILGLLVVVAGVILLFSGEYPKGLFDLVIGLNRWVYRVTAYVALMTDEYPPFRLDGGETEHPAGPAPPRPGEPASAVAQPPATVPPSPVGSAPPPHGTPADLPPPEDRPPEDRPPA